MGISQTQTNKIVSKKIFPTLELAEIYQPEFIKVVTTPLGGFDAYYLNAEGLHIEIGELELDE